MMGLKIFLGIILAILYVVMTTIMVIFERKKTKNIVIWSTVFIFTQPVGYIVYLIFRKVYYDKRNSLLIKEKEDEIYKKLVSNKLNDYSVDIDDDLLSFNEKVFDTNTTIYNNYEIFNSYEKFKDNLHKEIKNAQNYVFLEIDNFNALDFDIIKEQLIKKAKDGLLVRFTHNCRINGKLKKELKQAGIKIYRFSKHNTIDKEYSNLRNIISIDGKLVFVGNFLSTKMLKKVKQNIDIANLFVKFKGDVVQDMDLILRQDTAFASGKYIEYNKIENEIVDNNAVMQFAANDINTDIELIIIKAICMAKKSILLQLQDFVPGDSILSLLKYAVNSNIDVKLIVSIKTAKRYRSFASRAYAKELALYGANVYLYDGYINYNAITIDNEYVLFGSYTLDRKHISTSLQSLVIIKDSKAVNSFNKAFDSGINNSYRINNAKFMLIKEKFFKNFI